MKMSKSVKILAAFVEAYERTMDVAEINDFDFYWCGLMEGPYRDAKEYLSEVENAN